MVAFAICQTRRDLIDQTILRNFKIVLTYSDAPTSNCRPNGRPTPRKPRSHKNRETNTQPCQIQSAGRCVQLKNTNQNCFI